MSTVLIEFRPRAEQTAFNLRRWEEVLADPFYRQIERRVETDRHGRVIMSPPPSPRHGRFQIEIGRLLKALLPNGVTMSECPISTANGVLAADVAWASPECWRALGNRSCFIEAPEICMEIYSPGNSEEEIREKLSSYLAAGAKEAWSCGTFGKMSFYGPGLVSLEKSILCPEFPAQID